MKRTRLIQALLLAVLAVPAPGGGQNYTWSYRPSSQGWIGFFYRFSTATVQGQVRPVVVVQEVADDSPAQVAGLQVGDTLTHMDGQLISQEVFLSLSRTLEPGDVVPLTVRRGGRSFEITVEAASPPTEVIVEPDAERIRVELESLSGNILKELDSLRLSISGVRMERLPEDAGIQILRIPSKEGDQGHYSLQFRFSEPFLDSLPSPYTALYLSPDLALPFEAWVVESQATAQMKESLTQLRRELTEVRREELLRTRELAASARGPIEEVLRRDPRVQEIRTREEQLLAEQNALTRRLQAASEEEMQRQWAQIQSRNEEALLRAQRAQSEALRQSRRTWEEAEQQLLYRHQYAPGETVSPVIMGQTYILGAQLAPLNPQLAEYFPVERGIFVVQVLEGTPAFEAGLRGGDIIVTAGGEEMASLSDLRFGISASEGPLRIQVVRKGNPVEVLIRR